MRKSVCLMIFIFISIIPVSVMAAKKTMTLYTWDEVIGAQTSPSSYMISFENDLADFNSTPSTAGAVKKDLTAKTVSLGNNINDACGVLWYAGNNYCNEGICDFNKGFVVYFEFETSSKDTSSNSYDYADGFTFAVVNGTNNLTSFKNGTLRGGPPPPKSLGELLCYAGSGSDGIGIQAPKLAVEFDTGPSAGGMADYGCNCAGSTHRCSDGTCGTTCSLEQGRDDNSTNNHIAVMFWGNDNSGNCCSDSLPGGNIKKITYDDNVHGQGDGTEQNPQNSAGESSGYCERPRLGRFTKYHWMEDGQTHRVRIEVKRTDASRTYDIKAWVDCENRCCSSSSCTNGSCDLTKFQDVTLESYANNDPKISRTVTLDSTLNSNFSDMIFGFTVGSGWQTQTVTIKNFKLNFIH